MSAGAARDLELHSRLMPNPRWQGFWLAFGLVLLASTNLVDLRSLTSHSVPLLRVWKRR